MFNVEAGFKRYAEKFGKKQAIEMVADINQYTRLYTPKESPTEETAQPGLKYSRSLFDYNEHFIELSNWGEDLRTLFFMLAVLMFGIFPAIPIGGVIAGYVAGGFDFATIFLMMFLFGVLIVIAFLWSVIGAPVLFTHLRARYRFNRTTRKVYVLRPARYGGNVVLDWDRVQAHVMWRGRGEMTPEQLHDPTARLVRLNTLDFASVLLYWPPLDAKDPERKGEDVLWIGPELSDGALWQYIRTFMEEGIDAVPVPNEYEWLRKGYSNPAQHIEEVDLDLSRVKDRVQGRAKEGETSLQTKATFLSSFMWAPVHSLAERLCAWPTFPEEWNSDCGQKRRESGLGPEEPLRWTAR